METETRISATIAQLSQGEVPDSEELLGQLTVGVQFLTDFWREKYLQQFILQGGSKIKFLTGGKGSGKTHCLHLFQSVAKQEGYLTVSLSARALWLHDFREFYLEVLKQADVMSLLERCSDRIVEAMGFSAKDIEPGSTFLDRLAIEGLADGLTRREIRNQLKQMFLDNRRMDNNFSLACSLLCGSLLGHPALEQANKDLVLGWLHGDKKIRMTSLRPLGMAPSRITKYNARNLLRSLAELVHLAGYNGLVVTVDDLDVMVDNSGMNPFHYTKMKREDTYESIRQLIDDIDTFNHFFVVFGFGRELIDNENAGLKAYQALWMRIQNEVVSDRINKFTDIIDLDAVAMQVYTPDMLVEMSQKLASFVQHINVETQPIDEQTARNLIKQAKLGGVSIPRLVNQATLGLLKDDAEEGQYELGV
ncbi:MAG: BREX system ATP-binding domain-containing protein [Sphaerochaeta sp.]|jgi:hypothetical protein|uniref:BREX system ATP-binding domain-containing protein n=1 Tax=unclassified Sphaerochaeta TaxID=2637943 RepID=UPI000A517660|nr:BREX system ATP-binding domain-containing protein [Sphaerochaeta sp.]MCK9600806.1 ATP-binding protein [Sphaerochaeta sp.]MDX9825105.1 DUF2791 family P-loop domain-containing protein [Sphaerochaeta sp.]HPE93547.1 DUF2791 family P-loop domain-containing protein [Sphaerochaeta sp.]